MRTLLTLIIATLLVALSAPVLALAGIADDVTGMASSTPADNAVLRQSGCPSLNQAVERVRRQYNGRIVSAETLVRSGLQTHVIKVLTRDGTVKTVRVRGCRA